MHTLYDFITMTKGVEYLIAIAFMFGFIVFWKFVTQTRVQPAVERVSDLVRGIRDSVAGFFVPENAYYHPGHAWVRIDDKNVATIGMDDFAQRLVGNIDTIQLPGVGSNVRQGEKGWSLEVESRPIEMLSPIDGEVLAVNEEIMNSPAAVNADPYGKGWLMQIHAPRMSANVKNLLSGNLAKRWIEEARAHLLSMGGNNLGLVYQDGGLPVEGMAKSVNPDRWDTIAKEFFLISEE